MKIQLNGRVFDTADAIEIISTNKLFDTPGGVDGGASTLYRFPSGEFQVTPCRRMTVVQYSGFDDITGPNANGDNRARIV